MSTSRSSLKASDVVLSLALAASLFPTAPAWAQFKVVGPDGQITYTDRPPQSGGNKVTPIRNGSYGEDASLPPALRDLATRFPVVLYSVDPCGPCDEGRAYLRKRGVPYSEKVAVSPEDKIAWVNAVGSLQAPGLTVGAQAVAGWSANEWGTLLDAAGYPQSSRLPSSYKPAASSPLIEKRSPAARAASMPAPAPAAAPIPTPTPGEPGKIRF